MSLGFEQAGFDIVAAVEHDAAHAAAHRFNFPQCSVLQGDAMTLAADDIVRAVQAAVAHGREVPSRPQIDVLFGGPPCQGFSVGGRLDTTDPRNRLVERYVQLVEQLQPRAFVLENVPAMASRVLPRARLQCRSGSKAAWASAATSCRMRKTQRKPVRRSADRRRLLIVGVQRARRSPTSPRRRTPRTKRPKPLRAGEVGHPRRSPRCPSVQPSATRSAICPISTDSTSFATAMLYCSTATRWCSPADAIRVRSGARWRRAGPA